MKALKIQYQLGAANATLLARMCSTFGDEVFNGRSRLRTSRTRSTASSFARTTCTGGGEAVYSARPMRSLPKPARSVEDVLTRLRARLSVWEVRALFLGAQASTNLRVGPQHLLDQIFGPDRELGESLENANANIQALVWL